MTSMGDYSSDNSKYFRLISWIILLIQIWSVYSHGGNTHGGNIQGGNKGQCPAGFRYSQCSKNCPKTCGFWESGYICHGMKKVSGGKQCKGRGCVCPKGKYETWGLDLRPMCVANPNQCKCPGGMVYNRAGSPCTKTCNNPGSFRQNPDCQKKVPRCECPQAKPYWHNGRCVTRERCACGTKMRPRGTRCDECNECICNKGELDGCTYLPCPNSNTREGALEMAKEGCYRMSKGGMCVFYWPCPDHDGENCRRYGKPGGPCGCSSCQRCPPPPSDCPTQRDCRRQLITNILEGEGGWAAYKDNMCSFMLPGPEAGDGFCDNKPDGTMSCDHCNKCECISGHKVCEKYDCPKPDKGCVQEIHDKGCRWVSPCEASRGRCNYLAYLGPVTPDEKKGFCYKYNPDTDRCEFLMPCLGRCNIGDTICNKCNKCKCTDKNKVSCTERKCGDPLRAGCWIQKGILPFANECRFTSPCPWDSYSIQCTPFVEPTKKEMLEEGCWSAKKHGPCTFYYPCPFS